ncbi:MAG TPA: ParA family protein [candidate division WOR-3 bacterium]|uniref:ParA family protein n=1 Tax=candidate division WOR-3 bacterium TaxID=2052148 RepID=A0A7V5HNY1_UNCW3|nr:ParA family protein [candidate division WOR-3 bacterium]
MSSSQARVIAIANPKGGCGKTTTAINLGAFLADMNRKALLVDLDPQCNASIGLGIKPHLLNLSACDLFNDTGTSVNELIYRTSLLNLGVIPAKSSLIDGEGKLRTQRGAALILRKKLKPVTSKYNYILLDCDPSLGVLTLNALASSKEVIIPVQTQFYALRGLTQLLNLINTVKEKANPELSIRVLATMYDVRTNLSHYILEELQKHFKDRLFSTIIPVSTKLAEAPSSGLPINKYAPDSKGAVAYKQLAEEVISLEEK